MRRIDASPLWTFALPLAACLLLACSSPDRRSVPTATRPSPTPAAGAASSRASAPADSGALPSCFVAAEPASLPPGVRTAAFAPYRQPSPGATPPPAPHLAETLALTPFPVFALAEPPAGYAPAQLRVTTYPRPSGGAQQTLLVSVQYRIAPRAGGGGVLVLSGPSTGSMPQRDDLDDAIDAVRLEARLDGLPATPDPLADPASALGELGCPQHSASAITVQGKQVTADLISWPGAPPVQLLRFEAGATEVTIEAGGVSSAALLQLTAALRPASPGSALAQTLATVFDGPAAGTGAAASARATPARTSTPRR